MAVALVPPAAPADGVDMLGRGPYGVRPGLFSLTAVPGTPLLVQMNTSNGAMRLCVVLPPDGERGPHVECE
jgi:hypothetical protein